MEISITWEVALFLIIAYFTTRYLYETFMKMATGCRDPFNPLYSYKDYPVWKKGYNRGRVELAKEMRKMIAKLQTKHERLVKYLESRENLSSSAEVPSQTEQTK